MEEYLQYMKTLRCQMNDVEDQAAKISFEEQVLITGIQALEDDLTSAKLEMQKLGDESEQLTIEKGKICSRLLDVQKKVSAWEHDSLMLIQSLELIQQEIVSLSAKSVDKSAYYSKTVEELNARLQEQQEHFHSHSISVEGQEHFSRQGNEEVKSNKFNLRSSISRFNEIRALKAQVFAENAEMKQFVERLKCRATEFKQKLRDMDAETLEKEHETILSDKEGEMEFIKSLQDQIDKVLGVSHAVKCTCGEEYKIELEGRA